ncbi:MAG TPA: sulfotransferase [Solirubrobacteraceae bacterium]|nr:sulfotransferase [Solirubrobacteraceae bacterium]
MTASVTVEPGARPISGRLPDFFIVGHAKSGTTALYEMLRAHPQIYMPALKETRFFARDMHPGLRRSSSHPVTLEDYLALFAAAGPEQLAGEASPSYLRSASAAARIAALQPDARIIAILREPVSFLRSLHLQLLESHVETEKSLREAIAREPLRRREREQDQSSTDQGLLYSEHVRYVEQLERLGAVFAPEQVLVLIYDDFQADNDATVRRVLRFLGVDDGLALELRHANPTVRVRSPGMYRGLRSLYLGDGPIARPTKTAIKALVPRRLRRAGVTTLRRRMVSGEPAKEDEQLTRELRRRFLGEVVALSEYLRRDLVELWGYDHLA